MTHISLVGVHSADKCTYAHQKNIHNSIIHIPKMETTQMSINKRMDKQIMAYSHNRTLLSNENE